MYGAWVLMLVCVVFCTGAEDRYAREISESKLARGFVNALTKFTEDAWKGMKVSKMKETCDRLQDGITNLAQQIELLKTAAGPGPKRPATSMPDGIAIGIEKLKKGAKNIGVTTHDVLALTVGNGNMDVDNRRLQLSLKLLAKVTKDELKPDLDHLDKAVDGKVARKALDDLQGALRAISRILDGIKDTLTDAEITSKIQHSSFNRGYEDDDPTEREERTSRRKVTVGVGGELSWGIGGFRGSVGGSVSVSFWGRR